MSHIPGHWQDDGFNLAVGAARAAKKFGILKPETVDFEILCVNNRGTSYQKGLIGFHLLIIPFTDANGDEEFQLPLAFDIVDYEKHLKAEKEFIRLIDTDDDFQDLRDSRRKIELFTADEIKRVKQKFRKGSEEAKIADQTAGYVGSPSFVRLYKNKGAIEWIKDAINKKTLLKIDDFVKKQDKGTILL